MYSLYNEYLTIYWFACHNPSIYRKLGLPDTYVHSVINLPVRPLFITAQDTYCQFSYRTLVRPLFLQYCLPPLSLSHRQLLR